MIGKQKKNRTERKLEIPSLEAVQEELEHIHRLERLKRILRNTLYTLITVAAVAVLIATLWLPVLQIYGNSMTPTMENGEIVFSVKTADFEPGDIISFYYNNKILVKRVIARAGEWVDIDEDGLVYVNGRVLDEPYVKELALGDCNIELPFQVPDERVFVMGDHRSTSIDSRNTSVGCVSSEQIVGKIILRVWPFNRIGLVS